MLLAQPKVDDKGNMTIDLETGVTDPKNVLPAEVYQGAENYDIANKLEKEFYIDDFFNSCGANINYSVDDIKKDLQIDGLKIDPSELVICLGEGDAKLLNYLLSEGYNAYGMDVWYDLRSYNTWGVQETSVSRLYDMLSVIYNNQGRIFNAKANSLPLKTESVDKLFSNKMLNNVDPVDRQAVIMEVLRVLKVGGIAKISGYMPDIQDNKKRIEDFLDLLQGDGKISYEIVEKTIFSVKDSNKQINSYTISIQKTASISEQDFIRAKDLKSERPRTISSFSFSSKKLTADELVSLLSLHTGSCSSDISQQLDLLMGSWALKDGVLSEKDRLLLFGTEQKEGLYSYVNDIVMRGNYAGVDDLSFFLIMSGAVSWVNGDTNAEFGALNRDARLLISSTFTNLGVLDQAFSNIDLERSIKERPLISGSVKFMEVYRSGLESISVYKKGVKY